MMREGLLMQLDKRVGREPHEYATLNVIRGAFFRIRRRNAS
jgi:hypothetical protein